MADSADSVAPRNARAPRGASSKRRAAPAPSVSIDTENKLARAVQSAQRLAQLSDVPRDDSTLDMFPDDPTHALVQSMTIDVRQGTLSGFELPEVVRAAVEAAQGANPAPAPRRPARSKGAAAADAGDGEAETKRADGHEAGAAQTAGAVESGAPVTARDALEGDAPMSPGRLAAQARAAGASTARRSAAADDPASAGGAVEVAGDAVGLSGDADAAGPAGGVATAGADASDGRQADASRSRPEAAQATAAPAGAQASLPADHATPLPPDAMRAARTATAAQAPGEFAQTGAAGRLAAEPSARPALRAARPPVATPELDRARATAFADTVDALYGVIADQRRAAADLTRRMKWMLAIVAGALLVTVGVGVTQTLLLSRLARDAAAQQQRTEQMVQTQQAALASMLERVSAPATAPTPVLAAAAPSKAAAAHPAAPAPAPRHPHARRAHPPAH